MEVLPVTRSALYVIGGVLVAVLVLALAWTWDPFKRREKAETKAAVATQQATVSEASTKALDRVIRSEIIIRQQAAGAQANVQQAQGATDALDPAVALAIRAGLERMRDGKPGGANPDSGKPEGPM